MSITPIEQNKVSMPATPKPLYAQVRDLLLERVKAGEWSPGESLPNEFLLSSSYNVSIGTIRRAVSELEMNGVLLRKQGRGTYVAGVGQTPLEDKFAGPVGLDGQRLNLAYELSVIDQRPATSVEAASLKLDASDTVYDVLQHVTHADRTIGLERSAVSARRFPRLETQLRYGQHLYPVLAEYGCLITRVEDTIGIGEAADMARRLALTAEAQVLLVHRRALALDNEVVEVRLGRYLPAKVRWSTQGGDPHGRNPAPGKSPPPRRHGRQSSAFAGRPGRAPA